MSRDLPRAILGRTNLEITRFGIGGTTSVLRDGRWIQGRVRLTRWLRPSRGLKPPSTQSPATTTATPRAGPRRPRPEPGLGRPYFRPATWISCLASAQGVVGLNGATYPTAP